MDLDDPAEVSSQARACGLGIVKLRSNNRNAAGQNTWIDLICERGTKHKPLGKGLKSVDTRRVDCLGIAKAVMDSTGGGCSRSKSKITHTHLPKTISPACSRRTEAHGEFQQSIEVELS